MREGQGGSYLPASGKPAGGLEGAFLHLQRWKGEYKRLTYGGEGMPRLNGRRVFKLSRFGFAVYDVSYDPARGIDVTAIKPPEEHKDVTEMDDDEYERAVLQNLKDSSARGGGRG